MPLKQCLLALTLLLSGSLAEMCYECIETVSLEDVDTIVPNSCAGGMIDNNALPSSVKIKDCPSVGCHSSIVEVTSLGYKSYFRDCATRGINEYACKNKKSCVCHGDFCNGAGSSAGSGAGSGVGSGIGSSAVSGAGSGARSVASNVNARQAIMGIIAGVLTIVLMQH